MRTLVVYYSRTGHTRTVATALAKALSADLEELHCSRYSPGLWGFVRAAADNWKARLPRSARCGLRLPDTGRS